jgi:transcriptional regulator with XRE-family HTH domain
MEWSMAMTFGKAVKYHREKLGITQAKLGERLGQDSFRVTKVETGHTFRRMPPAEEFRAWADALEVPPEVLLVQMGYLDDPKDKTQKPELVFTSLAEEIRSADNLPAEVRTTALEGIAQARRMLEVMQKK